MSFLCRVAGRSLRDRVRSSVTREELGVEPLLLHIERSQLRCGFHPGEGRGKSGCPCSGSCPRDLAPDKRTIMDGWTSAGCKL